MEPIFFEDGERIYFQELNEKEIREIMDAVSDMLEVPLRNMDFIGEYDDQLIAKNVEYINNMANGYPLNKKLLVKLDKYGDTEWGSTMEVMFVPVK